SPSRVVAVNSARSVNTTERRPSSTARSQVRSMDPSGASQDHSVCTCRSDGSTHICSHPAVPSRAAASGRQEPDDDPREVLLAAGRRYLNLNVYLRNSGYHEAAWRVSAADPASVLDPRHYVGLAATAERGVLDSIFLPDSPGVAHFRSGYLPGAGLDPLQLLSAVA